MKSSLRVIFSTIVFISMLAVTPLARAQESDATPDQTAAQQKKIEEQRKADLQAEQQRLKKIKEAQQEEDRKIENDDNGTRKPGNPPVTEEEKLEAIGVELKAVEKDLDAIRAARIAQQAAEAKDEEAHPHSKEWKAKQEQLFEQYKSAERKLEMAVEDCRMWQIKQERIIEERREAQRLDYQREDERRLEQRKADQIAEERRIERIKEEQKEEQRKKDAATDAEKSQ